MGRGLPTRLEKLFGNKSVEALCVKFTPIGTPSDVARHKMWACQDGLRGGRPRLKTLMGSMIGVALYMSLHEGMLAAGALNCS